MALNLAVHYNLARNCCSFIIQWGLLWKTKAATVQYSQTITSQSCRSHQGETFVHFNQHLYYIQNCY